MCCLRDFPRNPSYLKSVTLTHMHHSYDTYAQDTDHHLAVQSFYPQPYSSQSVTLTHMHVTYDTYAKDADLHIHIH